MEQPILHIRIITGLCVVCLCALASLFSCTQRDKYIGTYKIEGGVPAESAGDYIELKENGAGVWRIKNDEFAFGWNLKAGKVYVHTRDGVVIGRFEGDNLMEISLPGSRVRHFRRQ